MFQRIFGNMFAGLLTVDMLAQLDYSYLLGLAKSRFPAHELWPAEVSVVSQLWNGAAQASEVEGMLDSGLWKVLRGERASSMTPAERDVLLSRLVSVRDLSERWQVAILGSGLTIQVDDEVVKGFVEGVKHLLAKGTEPILGEGAFRNRILALKATFTRELIMTSLHREETSKTTTTPTTRTKLPSSTVEMWIRSTSQGEAK